MNINSRKVSNAREERREEKEFHMAADQYMKEGEIES